MTWTATTENPPVVLLECDQSEPRLLARDELARYLERVLDARCQSAMARGDAPRIVLRVDAGAGMSDEGYQWRIGRDALVISSGGDLGLLFGVYAFLREVCGCSFAGLGPDSEDVPRRQRIVVERDIDAREPIIWYRGVQFSYVEKPELVRWHIDWMVKNGLNYVMYMLAPDETLVLQKPAVDPRTGEPLIEFGKRSPRMHEDWCERFVLAEARRRGLKLDMNHHNLAYWLTPGRYFQQHPEWFALTDGQRGKQFNQLFVCTSNEEAVSTLIANVLTYLRNHPDVRIVGVIPEDGNGMCQCDACVAGDPDPRDAFRNWGQVDSRASDRENQSLAIRYARLLNRVADAVRAEFPQVLVGGAAYVDLQWPPDGVELRDNIVMWVALYWRDGARTISPENKTYNAFYHDLLRRWRARHPGRVTLYEYHMGMNAQRSLPYPMSQVIGEDWAEYRRLGIDGTTAQCSTAAHQAYALNMLAFARCGWQQRVDHDALLDEFLRGMFGSVGDTIRPIYAGFLEAARQFGVLQPRADNIAFFVEHVGVEVIEQALAEAERLAASPREHRQVELFSNYMRYCILAAQNSGEIVEFLEATPMPGWVAPAHAARWQALRPQVAK